MKGSDALSQVPELQAERECEVRLYALLHAAREVGRAAGAAALEAGEAADALGQRPETRELVAALQRTLPLRRAPLDRSLNERMDALARANEIRSQRAQLKRDLKAGNRSIDTLFLDPPAFIETAKVADILLAAPGMGRVSVNRILVQCRISPSKTIRGLSERQRITIVSMLRG